MASLEVSDAEMSDVDSELVTSSSERKPPTPIKFLLPPGLWAKCQTQPFRFLDLPPELRNRIYEHAFTGSHGLSPHHLTQVNRQIMVECLRMYHATTRTLQIPLQTPAQMTCFLKWAESPVAEYSFSMLEAYEFTYTDVDVGETTIRLTQGDDSPAMAYDVIKSILPQYQEDDIMLMAWRHFIGITYGRLHEDFGQHFELTTPTEFVEAITEGSLWTYHLIEFVGEKEPSFPAASIYAKEFFLFFTNLSLATSNKEWDNKYLLDTANFLFKRSMHAGLMAKRKS